MKKISLEAPWFTHRKMVNALFERDPDITVGEVYQPEDGKTDYAFDIEVRSHEKFLALDRALPKVKTFGNVTLGIVLFDEENTSGVDLGIELYETIFCGNPIVKDIREAEDNTGTRHGFVRFQPEVIQFFHDDISDYNGNWSGLAQDIACEVFEGGYGGIHFCTAGIHEAGADAGKPLGEWP